MNEHNTWEWLRDVALPNGHYSRIEAPETAPGFPDVTFSILGCDGTIELKYGTGAVPFPNEDKGLHKSQLIWFRQNCAVGGNCWIIAEVPPRILVIHGECWDQFNGATAEQLYEMSAAVVYRENERDAPEILGDILTSFRL